MTGPGGDEARPRRRLRRWALGFFGILLLAYVGVAAVFYSLQTGMIFPGSDTQGMIESDITIPPGAELVRLTTTSGDRVVVLFGKALGPDGAPRADASDCPTLLYFYGNAMCLGDATGQFEAFRRLGANVLIPDYAGYGLSGGRPGEIGCRETAEAALAYLESRKDVDRGRIVAGGWSLGGAVALDLASRHPVSGVVTFCTFTRMADMARRLFPWLPASLLLRHQFDNASKIATVGCPVLIGHGRQDQIIPFEMSDRLAALARGSVTRVTIDEADHNDFFRLGGDRVMSPLSRFLHQLPRRP